MGASGGETPVRVMTSNRLRIASGWGSSLPVPPPPTSRKAAQSRQTMGRRHTG
jgi:hypothetical protein